MSLFDSFARQEAIIQSPQTISPTEHTDPNVELVIVDTEPNQLQSVDPEIAALLTHLSEEGGEEILLHQVVNKFAALKTTETLSSVAPTIETIEAAKSQAVTHLHEEDVAVTAMIAYLTGYRERIQQELAEIVEKTDQHVTLVYDNAEVADMHRSRAARRNELLKTLGYIGIEIENRANEHKEMLYHAVNEGVSSDGMFLPIAQSSGKRIEAAKRAVAEVTSRAEMQRAYSEQQAQQADVALEALQPDTTDLLQELSTASLQSVTMQRAIESASNKMHLVSNKAGLFQRIKVILGMRGETSGN